MTASFVSQWIEAREAKALVIHISNDAGASPVGTWSLEGSNDPKIKNERWSNPAGTSSAKFGTLAAAADSVVIMSGALAVAGAVDCIVKVVDPPAFVRVRYTRTSGSATGNVWAFGRV